jgi:hypothetical protein
VDDAERLWAPLRARSVQVRGGVAVVREGALRRDVALWPYTQVFHAAVTVDPPLVGALVRGLDRYRSGDAWGPHGGGRPRFADDVAWLGLALLDAYDAGLGTPAILDRARAAARFTRLLEHPDGGVRWHEHSPSRNACSTAPAAQLAARLARIDGDEGGPAFAARCLSWIDAALLRDDGLIDDRVEPGGRDRSVWTYNQGATARARLELGLATSDSALLDEAHGGAERALRRFDLDRLWKQPPAFNGIFAHDLAAIDALRPLEGLHALLDAYRDRVMRTALDPRGFATRGGIGTYDGRPTIDQAGLVRSFMVLRRRD